MPRFEHTRDPDRPGAQLLLHAGRPAGLVWWAHDYEDRSATGWFLQRLGPDGEPEDEDTHTLAVSGEVLALADDRSLDRTTWIAHAETLELVTAQAALEAAERQLARLLPDA